MGAAEREASQPELSVVIPVRNGRDVIESCLESLFSQTVPLEVIVVDDGSTDGSGELARRLGASVVRQDPRGRAAARNEGVRSARGRVVLFTDADCRPASDWAAKLAAPLLGREVDGVVGRIISRQQSGVAKLIQFDLESRYDRMKKSHTVDFANTGNCGFSRHVLLQYPFDETLEWLEDVELSFRLVAAGISIRYLPEAEVEHRHPESLAEYFRHKFNYARRSPVIYRSFPEKLLSDSGNSFTRRLQILLFLLSVISVILWKPVLAFVLVMVAVSLSAPVIVRSAQRSLWLALLSPLFVIVGTAGTSAGLLRGILPLERIARDRIDRRERC